VRGYITGSGWKDYKKTGKVCGHELPAGLQESQKLPRTLFTPSTKADEGHDENISVEQAKPIVGPQIAEYLAEASISIFEKAQAHAASVGIILADTKVEFGLIDGRVSLIDEVLTPDSSRFWPALGYAAGKGQPSFDKQYVRDYYEGMAWDKNPPAPELPAEVVEKTLEKYREAYCRLTGRKDAPV